MLSITYVLKIKQYIFIYFLINKGHIMYLVWLGTILVILKWFEVAFFKDLSWIWIVTPLILAFIYFEVLEPILGLDKKKVYDKAEEYKQKRIQKQLKGSVKK